MALTIDDEMNVDMDNMDDLFGDGSNGLLPEAQPPPKELYQRIEELRSSGCHQTVTWSRQGCIASITSSGRLEIQNLRTDPKDGSWALSEPVPVPHVLPSNHGFTPLQHLCWSPNGMDLAAIDAAGRVAMFTISFLNRAQVMRNVMQDPVDELHSVVGAHWLNLIAMAHPKFPALYSMAVKTSSQGYRYESCPPDAFGPMYPMNQMGKGKSAFICVTTSGLLRLFWVAENGWREITHELENMVSSDDLITHASMCPDKDQTLLLTYATSSKQLRVSRIAIKWQPAPVPPNAPKEQQQQHIPLRPPVNVAIRVTHLTSTNFMDVTPASDSAYVSSAATALSHLKILSPCGPADQQGALKPATIVTIRTNLPPDTSFFGHEVHSLIERWEIKESIPQIHSAFQQLSARRDSVGSKQKTTPTGAFFLKRMDSVSNGKVITWVDTIHLERVVVFGYSDGSVEYVDRHSLENISSKGGLDKFYHLTQIGFSFNESEPTLTGAISPAGLAVTYKTNDGKVKWQPLRYNSNDIDSPSADTHYTAIIAALSLPALKEAIYNGPNDDIIAVASQFKALEQRNTAYDLTTEVSKNMGSGKILQCDYAYEEHADPLINNNHLHWTLGMMVALSYKGEASHRDFPSMIAWMESQLRYSVMLMSMIGQNVKGPGPAVRKTTTMDDPEFLRAIIGTVRWSLDLISWITDSLIHPNDPDEFDETFIRLTTSEPLDLKALSLYLFSTRNVALHLLLSSTTRGFLIAIIRRLHSLDYIARSHLDLDRGQRAAGTNVGANNFPRSQMSAALAASYLSISHLTSQSVVSYSQFEKLITKVGAHVKEAYAQAGLRKEDRASAQTRNKIEQQILFGGELPPQAAYAVCKIFKEDLPALKEEIDPAKLFFHDFSILGLPQQDRIRGGDEKQRQRRREKYAKYRVRHAIDIFQKKEVELGKEPEEKDGRVGRRWRRCVRCAAVMEDLRTSNSCVGLLMRVMQRCHCMGQWDVIGGKRVVP